MAAMSDVLSLNEWLDQLKQTVQILKNSTQQQHSMSAAGTLDSDFIRRYYDLLKQVHVRLAAANAVTGLESFLVTQLGSVIADPSAYLNGISMAVDASIDWMNANVPSGIFGGVSYKLGHVFPADYTTPASALVFTSGQTSGYRTTLTSLLTAIEF